jgi:hypothetical protein
VARSRAVERRWQLFDFDHGRLSLQSNVP